MDLGDLRGMSKVSSGKSPATRAAAPAREVSETPSNEASRSSSKRPSDGSAPQSDDPTWKQKKVKQKIDTLKLGGVLEAVAATEEWATELEKELERIKHERDEHSNGSRLPTKNLTKPEVTYLRPEGSLKRKGSRLAE
ncbi:hypothetical protein GW17_00061649 [Ensete ventricosum]|nr:hypothetical protein GW17_00061649 [Ensete ventricosum]